MSQNSGADMGKEKWIIEILIDGDWVKAKDPVDAIPTPEFDTEAGAAAFMAQAWPKITKMQEKGMPPAIRCVAVVLA